VTDAEQNLADIKAMFRVLDERTSGMKDDLDSVKHVLLEGNGSPALTVQVATIDTRLKTVEEARRDDRTQLGVPRSVSVSIVASVIIGLVGLLAAFAK
jgi:hypothetical protein